MRSKEEIPVVIAEIKEEMEKLEILVEKLLSQKGRTGDEEVAESASLRLHNFYTGCERIFKLVASEVNGAIPRELDWHRRLLTQMAIDIEGVRPPVISRETMKGLEELLRFRHVVRNIYGYELESARIEDMISLLTGLYRRFVEEVGVFISFLDGVHQQSSKA
ncbi:MAG: hypothetical protein JRJ85_25965 [Deltaproteobacteria bacterium]|nr:hypothetical protein [Deltaproteobacteria bacterium]